jgi:kynurenine formamidase
MTEDSTTPEPTAEEIEQFFASMSNWGRWGEDDVKGALNFISPAKVREAAALVTEGVRFTLSRIISFAPNVDPGEYPVPPMHFMDSINVGGGGDRLGSVTDWASFKLHGSPTHLDAHSHIFWQRQIYNGQSSSEIDIQGARVGGVDVAHDGFISRAVLLDIPKVRGIPYLTDADGVTAADLDAAEKVAGVQLGEGDIALVRTGHGLARLEKSGSDFERSTGLLPSCLPWIHERSLSVLATDSSGDVRPGRRGMRGIYAPVHAVCLVAMGMFVIDNCDLDVLARECEQRGRWEVCFVAAPLRMEHATGSPMNPIAIF